MASGPGKAMKRISALSENGLSAGSDLSTKSEVTNCLGKIAWENIDIDRKI